jgi:hypothetical protein
MTSTAPPLARAGRKTAMRGRTTCSMNRSLIRGSDERCSIRSAGAIAGMPGADPGYSAIISTSAPDVASSPNDGVCARAADPAASMAAA